MLRFAKQNIRSLQQTQKLSNIQKKTIVNPRVLIDPSEKKYLKKLDLYHLVGERNGNIAIVTLNKDYKNNLLTPTMIDELNRFLASYELDPSIKAVQLQGKDNANIVSKGTDFSYLLKNSEANQHEKNEEYLRKLYTLAYNLGKYNKPLFVNLNGATHNSAATIFSNLPFTLTSDKTYLKFDDIDFAITPLMGSSYHLSRLSYELGTFLALTGLGLKGKQASFSGIGKKFLENEESFLENLQQAQRDFDDSFTSENLYGDKFVEQSEEHDFTKKVFYQTLQQEIKDRILNTEGKQHEQQRLAMAEIMYKKESVEHANRKDSVMSRLGYKQQETVNHLLDYENNVIERLNMVNLEFSLNEGVDSKLNSLPLNVINRCFSKNSVEEIIESLEKEGTEWSQKIVKCLQGKNKLTLKLTLKLLREGRKSSWQQCLQNEFRVAIRRIRDSDFKSTAHYFFEKYYSSEIQNPSESSELSSVSDNQVNNYFKDLSSDLKISDFGEDLPQDALYPVKEFYQKYPDVVRYFLNEENITSPIMRESFQFDIKTFLHSKNIDFLRNWSLSTSVLRNKIFNQEFQQQQVRLQVDKLKTLAQDFTGIQIYQKQRESELEAFFKNNNTEQVKEKVNAQIADVFEKYFEQRLSHLKSISERAFVEKKQEFMLRIRQNLFNSRLITQIDQEEIMNPIADEDSSFDFRFPEKNSQNIFDARRQTVEKSPVYGLLQELKKQGKEDEYFLKNYNVDKEKLQQILGVLEKQTYDQTMFSLDQFSNQDKRVAEYKERFGDHFEEEKDLYLEKLVQKFGNQNEKIKQFIEKYSTQQIRDFIKENDKQNYRFLGEELLTQLEHQQILQSHQLESAQGNTDVLVNKKVVNEVQSGKEGYSSLLDLNVKSLSQQDSAKKDQTQLETYLENDRYLNEILAPFAKKQQQQQQGSKGVEQVRQRFYTILQHIYKHKTSQILVNEKQFSKEDILTTQLTADGKSVFNSKEKADKHTQLLDQFISGNLQHDFHNFIGSHIFFTFASVGLQELSEIFKNLYTISRKYNLAEQEDESVQKIKGMISSVSSTLKITIESPQEIKELLDYLNDCTEAFCLIYMMYKNKLIFPEDKLLSVSNTAQMIRERDFDDLGFASYVLTAFEEMESNKKQQETEYQSIDAQLSVNEGELQKFLSSNQVLKNPADTQRCIDTVKRNIYKLQSFQKQKRLLPSAILYIEKLDLLTQQIIHGKDHFIPEEEKQIMESLPEELQTIDPSLTQEQWISIKINQFLESLFEIRYKCEKSMTKNELTQFDVQLSQFLTSEYLQKQLQDELSTEVGQLKVLGEILKYNSQNEVVAVQNQLKYKNQKKAEIKNFEAQQKLLAFQIMKANNPLYEEEKPKQNQLLSKKKLKQLIQNKEKNEQKKIQDQFDMDQDENTEDRLSEEQFFTPSLKSVDHQQLYREVLGVADYSMTQQEQISEKIKRRKENQFTPQELKIPLTLLAEDNVIGDGLRSEIKEFLKTMQ